MNALKALLLIPLAPVLIITIIADCMTIYSRPDWPLTERILDAVLS